MIQTTELGEATSLADVVHRRLRDDVVSGRLAPGDRLVERELAASLEVSRVPVREALQRLSREGFVDLVPNRGAYVHEPSATELEDLFILREILEGAQARLAAMRHTPEQLAEIRGWHERAIQSFDDGHHEDGMAATVGFHQALGVAANNKTLASVAEPIERRVEWTLHRNHNEDMLIREHNEILEAIAARDGVRAEILVRRHAQHGWANSQRPSAG